MFILNWIIERIEIEPICLVCPIISDRFKITVNAAAVRILYISFPKPASDAFAITNLCLQNSSGGRLRILAAPVNCNNNSLNSITHMLIQSESSRFEFLKSNVYCSKSMMNSRFKVKLVKHRCEMFNDLKVSRRKFNRIPLRSKWRWMIFLTRRLCSRNPPRKSSPISSTVAHPLVFVICFSSSGWVTVVVKWCVVNDDGVGSSRERRVRNKMPIQVKVADAMRRQWSDTGFLLDLPTNNHRIFTEERRRCCRMYDVKRGPCWI